MLFFSHLSDVPIYIFIFLVLPLLLLFLMQNIVFSAHANAHTSSSTCNSYAFCTFHLANIYIFFVLTLNRIPSSRKGDLIVNEVYFLPLLLRIILRIFFCCICLEISIFFYFFFKMNDDCICICI